MADIIWQCDRKAGHNNSTNEIQGVKWTKAKNKGKEQEGKIKEGIREIRESKKKGGNKEREKEEIREKKEVAENKK